MKLKVCLIIFLLISLSQALLADVELVADNKIREQYLTDVKSIFLKDFEPESFNILSHDNPYHLEFSKLLNEILPKAYEYKQLSSHHMDGYILYTVEIDESKHSTNVSVKNISDEHTAIVIQLPEAQLQSVDRESLQFVTSHEIGHGFVNMKKRYFMLNENFDYKLPRFTSEELAGSEKHQLLYDIIENVGFSKSIGTVNFLLSKTLFNRLIIEAGDMLSSLNESIGLEEEEENNDENNFFSEIFKTYSEFHNDYLLDNKHKQGFEQLHLNMKKINETNPKSSIITLNYFCEQLGWGDESLKYLKAVLLYDQQVKLYSEKAVSKMNIFILVNNATELYQKKYDENKAYNDNALSRIRFYSAENIADESGYRIMGLIGKQPSSYLKGFLSILGLNESEVDLCLNKYIAKDKEPPIGLLSVQHPAACWRAYSIHKLYEADQPYKPESGND